MEQPNTESRLLQARSAVCLADLKALTDFCDHVGIEKQGLDTRTKVIKAVDRWLEEEFGEENKGPIALLALEQFAEEVLSEKQQAKETEKIESPKATVKSEVLEVRTPTSDAANEFPKTDTKVQTGMTPFRKEFKIHGQVDAERGLPFVSLVRQIETGLKKGFTNVEITDAVIRAVPAGGMRCYLEGKSELTLGSLRQILRAHYKEKSATELYSELCQLSQHAKESPTDFLLRALNLRQKILFASKEEKAEVKYDSGLVDKVFVRTLDTGLTSEVIRQEIVGLLDKMPQLEEEELIEHLSRITMKEEERSSKLFKKKSTGTHVTSVQENKTPEPPKKKDFKEGMLSREVKELRSQVAELREVVTNSSKAAVSRSPKPQARKCSTCVDNNQPVCDHCWCCGSSDHFARGCRNRTRSRRTNQSGPENDLGLLPRDRQ